MPIGSIQLKRAYDEAEASDGLRFLVDRLWPRGIKKSDLKMEAWLKDVAPSTELRKWFNHDPAKWSEFQKRYRAELDQQPEAVAPLLEAARKGKVTLVYSANDEEHNDAVVLADYLRHKLSRSAR